MSILSNHTPDCRVECTVECNIDELTGIRDVQNCPDFAERFALAVRIAEIDPYRAVTHNKGVYNGIGAVILATANDFRAVEAAGHAYASITGQYKSLTGISLENKIFRYSLEVPMAVGTIGGLTRSHPLAAASLEILGNPCAGELMQIAASAGLANNFAALKALVTTGIQAGHMPLHHRKNE
jgi:hydroxymethylglutaryl-CoA reductase